MKEENWNALFDKLDSVIELLGGAAPKPQPKIDPVGKITLFGMHDRGGEHLMVNADVHGWVLVTEAIGSLPGQQGGHDYSNLEALGLKVIVRLNHGYGSTGTIPLPGFYQSFARRCASFVSGSQGCHRWIIGNEPNLKAERPDGQTIYPWNYADCFRVCREDIKQVGERHQVITAAVGPWNVETRYASNAWGDWMRYQNDVLRELDGELDGIAIHAYTHGHHEANITSEAMMAPPFQNRHWHFRTYQDSLRRVPESASRMPVYLTEMNPLPGWKDVNNSWIEDAYNELGEWNDTLGNQKIHAGILFRWILGANNERERSWAIESKPGVQEDFRWAMGGG